MMIGLHVAHTTSNTSNSQHTETIVLKHPAQFQQQAVDKLNKTSSLKHQRQKTSKSFCLIACMPTIVHHDSDKPHMSDDNSAAASDDEKPFVPYQILNRPIYHMCVKKEWQDAHDGAYFPPTFKQDGRKTHASMFGDDKLLATANHFYKSSKEEWICLQLDPNVLLKLGIPTIVEPPAAVGDQAGEITATNSKIRYPHIYGGIATSVPELVTKVYPMTRDKSNGTFLSIPGLVE